MTWDNPGVVHGKWCVHCGQRVDMRRDYALNKGVAAKMGIRNPQYCFIHRKKCNDELRKELNIFSCVSESP